MSSTRVVGEVDDKNLFQMFVEDVVAAAYPRLFPHIDLRHGVVDMVVQNNKCIRALVYAPEDESDPIFSFDECGVTLKIPGAWPRRILYADIDRDGAYGVPALDCVRSHRLCRDTDTEWCAHAPVFADARLVIDRAREVVDEWIHRQYHEHAEVWHESCWGCICQKTVDDFRALRTCRARGVAAAYRQRRHDISIVREWEKRYAVWEQSGTPPCD